MDAKCNNHGSPISTLPPEMHHTINAHVIDTVDRLSLSRVALLWRHLNEDRTIPRFFVGMIPDLMRYLDKSDFWKLRLVSRALSDVTFRLMRDAIDKECREIHERTRRSWSPSWHLYPTVVIAEHDTTPDDSNKASSSVTRLHRITRLSSDLDEWSLWQQQQTHRNDSKNSLQLVVGKFLVLTLRSDEKKNNEALLKFIRSHGNGIWYLTLKIHYYDFGYPVVNVEMAETLHKFVSHVQNLRRQQTMLICNHEDGSRELRGEERIIGTGGRGSFWLVLPFEFRPLQDW